MAGFSIHVEHTLDDLQSDMVKITRQARPKLSRVVRINTVKGRKSAAAFARKASGRHGVHYWKRITDEMRSPLEGEYGPHTQVWGNAVGAGYKHGAGNHDLEKSLDVVGPKFRKDVDDVIDSLFWPA